MENNLNNKNTDAIIHQKHKKRIGIFWALVFIIAEIFIWLIIWVENNIVYVIAPQPHPFEEFKFYSFIFLLCIVSIFLAIRFRIKRQLPKILMVLWIVLSLYIFPYNGVVNFIKDGVPPPDSVDYLRLPCIPRPDLGINC